MLCFSCDLAVALTVVKNRTFLINSFGLGHFPAKANNQLYLCFFIIYLRPLDGLLTLIIFPTVVLNFSLVKNCCFSLLLFHFSLIITVMALC